MFAVLESVLEYASMVTKYSIDHWTRRVGLLSKAIQNKYNQEDDNIFDGPKEQIRNIFQYIEIFHTFPTTSPPLPVQKPFLARYEFGIL